MLSLRSSPRPSLVIDHDIPLPDFQNPPDKYKCSACNQIMREPFQLPCGHHVCNFCGDELSRQTAPSPCPSKDRECDLIGIGEDTQIFPDACVAREMKKLKVFCIYAKFGCKESLRWGSLQQHIAECQYAKEECPHADCNETFMKAEKTQHLNSCPHAIDSCRHCGEQLKRMDMERHEDVTCQEIYQPCPYMCGEQSIRRRHLAEHKKRCPSRPKECHLKSVGCTFQGSEAEVAQHEASAGNEHLQLSTRKIEEQGQQLSGMQKKLQAYSENEEALKKKALEACDKATQLSEEVRQYKERTKSYESRLTATQDRVKELERQVEEHKAEEKRRVENLDKQIKEETRLRINQAQETSMSVSNIEHQVSAISHQVSEVQQNASGLDQSLIRDIELRFQCLESANYDGVLIWKISDYKRRKQEAIRESTLSLYSQPFYTGRYGYKMCARVYLNGDGMGKGTHLSLFFVVMKGDYDAVLPWPFNQRVTMSLLDQTGAKKHTTDAFRPDITSNSFQRPKVTMNVASGCPMFCAQSVVEKDYLKDDAIFIRIQVDKTGLDLRV